MHVPVKPRKERMSTDGNRWLLPTSSPTDFWSLGFLCISEWERSSVQTPNRWVWFLWVVHALFFLKCRTSQQTSLQSYRKVKKKAPPQKCHHGFSSFIIHLKRMIIFCRACVPHTHFSSFHWEDFTSVFWPSALPPRASFTQGRYRDVIKRTNHLGSSPEDNHPPTPSFLWLHLQHM